MTNDVKTQFQQWLNAPTVQPAIQTIDPAVLMPQEDIRERFHKWLGKPEPTAIPPTEPPTEWLRTQELPAMRRELIEAQPPSLGERALKGFVRKAAIAPARTIISKGAPGKLDTLLKMQEAIERGERVVPKITGLRTPFDIFRPSVIKQVREVTAPYEAEVERETAEMLGEKRFIVPPAGTIPERVVEVGTGVAAFVTKIAIAKRILGGHGLSTDVAAWEAVNIVEGGIPGTGASIRLTLGAIGKIPGKSIYSKTGRLLGPSGLLAGLVAVSGGTKEDIMVAALIPLALRAVDISAKYALEKRAAKAIIELRNSAKVKGLELKNVPDEALRGIIESAKQARWWHKQYKKGKIEKTTLDERTGEISNRLQPVFRAIAQQQPKKPIVTPKAEPKVKPITTIATKPRVRPVQPIITPTEPLITPKAPEIKLPAKVAGMGYLLDDGTILKDMGAASHINLIRKIPEGKKVVDAGFLDAEGNYLMRDDVIKKGKTYAFVEPDGTVVQAKIVADDVDPEMLMDGVTIEIPSGKFNIEREQLLKPVEEQFKGMLEQWETAKSTDKRFGSDYAGPKPVLKPIKPTPVIPKAEPEAITRPKPITKEITPAEINKQYNILNTKWSEDAVSKAQETLSDENKTYFDIEGKFFELDATGKGETPEANRLQAQLFQMVDDYLLAKAPKVEAPAKIVPKGKIPVKIKKRFYTSVPEGWHKVEALYDWGAKGLRSRGNRYVEDGKKRKTFVWQNEMSEIPVGTPGFLREVKRRTDEVWPVKEKRGKFWITGYYLAPKQVVSEVRSVLGEKAIKPIAKRKPPEKRVKRGLFDQPIFEPITGEQLELGLGERQIRPEALRAVPIKNTLRQFTAKALSSLGPPKNPQEIYLEIAGQSGYFNNPQNPMPEVRTAWNEAVKGRILPEIEQQKALDEFLGHVEKPSRKPGFVIVPQPPKAVTQAATKAKESIKAKGQVAKETIDELRFYPKLPMEFRNAIRKDFVGALEKSRANVYVHASKAIWGGMGSKDVQDSVEIIFARDQLSRAKLGKGHPELNVEDSSDMLDDIMLEATPEAIAAADRFNQISEKYQEVLIKRGVLDEKQVIPFHARHYVTDYTPDWAPTTGIPIRLRRPFRGYAKKAVGTIKEYRQDQEALLTSLQEMEYDNLVEDFIETQARKYNIKPSLSREQRIRLFGTDKAGKVNVPKPNHIYIVNDKKYRAYTPDIPFSRQLFPTEDGLMALGKFKNVVLLPEDIYNTFRNFSQRGSRAVSLLNRATGYWKSMAILSHFPSFNINNMIGDTWMAMIQHPTPLKLLGEYDTALRYLTSRNPAKDFPELHNFINEHNVLMGTFVAGELPQIKKSRNPLSMLLRGSYRFSAFRESINRLAYASTGLKAMKQGEEADFVKAHNWIDTEGLNAKDAIGKISRDVLIDYNWVSKPFRRFIRGAAFPFGTWYFKASPLLWRWMSKHWGKALIAFMSMPVIATAYNNRRKEIQELETELPDYVRNRVHFVFGENPDGTIRVLSLQLPQDVLIGTKIFSIMTDYANRVANKEMTAREAALKMIRMWGIREAQGIAYLASPWIRFFQGLASANRLDPYDKAPIYSRDPRQLSAFDRKKEQLLYFVKCSVPFLAQGIRHYQKGLPKDLAVRQMFDRLAGKGALGIYDVTRQGKYIYEDEAGKKHEFTWDDVAKMDAIAKKEMKYLGKFEDDFVASGLPPLEFMITPTAQKSLLKIYNYWAKFEPALQAEKEEKVKLELVVSVLDERIVNRFTEPSVMQKWFIVKLQRAKTAEEKRKIAKELKEIRAERLYNTLKKKPVSARTIELINKMKGSELPWDLILTLR